MDDKVVEDVEPALLDLVFLVSEEVFVAEDFLMVVDPAVDEDDAAGNERGSVDRGWGGCVEAEAPSLGMSCAAPREKEVVVMGWFGGNTADAL